MEGYSGGYGYGDGETMCRGHWEAYNAAVKRGIEADEEEHQHEEGAQAVDVDWAHAFVAVEVTGEELHWSVLCGEEEEEEVEEEEAEEKEGEAAGVLE